MSTALAQNRIPTDRWLFMAVMFGGMAGIALIFEASVFFDFKFGPGSNLILSMLYFALVWFFASRSFSTNHDLFHPLVYAAWWYFVLQFVVPTVLGLIGFSSRSLTGFLTDRWDANALALLASAAAWLGLVAGFHLAGRTGVNLPIGSFTRWKWNPQDLRLTAIILYIISWAWLLYAFSVGLVGFHMSASGSIPTYLNLLHVVFYHSWLAAQLIMWMGFFSASRSERKKWLLHLVLIAAGALVYLVISGSKGALFGPAMHCLMAYQYTKRARINDLAKFLVVMVLLAAAGILINSTFRTIKAFSVGSGTHITLDEQLKLFSGSLRVLDNMSGGQRFDQAVEIIVQRTDGASQLAYVLQSAGTYKSMEKQYGVANNIIRDSFLAWIPRSIWPGKPKIGGGQTLGYIYYGVENHTPAIHYSGDLYRNFGPIGIPLGMIFIGFAMAVIYNFLIIGSRARIGGIVVYTALLNVANYEAQYSIFLPAIVQYIPPLVVMVVMIATIVEFERILRRRAGQVAPAPALSGQ